MQCDENISAKTRSVHATEWLNFFLADVQSGVGPFVAAYLAASGWSPDRVGFALTLGGIVTVLLQTPAGAMVDAGRDKRAMLAGAIAGIGFGALILALRTTALFIDFAQILIGAAGSFLGPTVAAITLGIVGKQAFDRQFGRNQGFNSAGNVAAALLLAAVGYAFGIRAIFFVTIGLAIPALAVLVAIDPRQIDYSRARASDLNSRVDSVSRVQFLSADRPLLMFCFAAFLFHLANAAMLPELGELLARGKVRSAAPFMSACVIVTQLVITLTAAGIGRRAGAKGRKGLLLLGFGVLPIRGALYALTRSVLGLIAIQFLDGVANAIFGVVSMLVVLDRTRGTGRFNLAQGVLATTVAIGAALSNALGGELVERLGYNASFLSLGFIGLVALFVLWLTVPETLPCGAEKRELAPTAAVPLFHPGAHL